MASFSSGLGIGANVANSFLNRRDLKEQNAVQNAINERKLGILEEEEGRRAATYDYLNNTNALEGQFNVIDERPTQKAPNKNASVVDVESFANDVRENGDMQATLNVFKGAFGGNPQAFLSDKVGQQIGLSVMNWSPKFKKNAESNTGWTPSKIVQVDDGSGEPKFMIGMVDANGNESAMTKQRGNDKEPVLFSSGDFTGLIVDGMREKGAFTDPKMIQQLEEAGFDVEETMRQFGADTSDKVPTASSLEGVKEVLNTKTKAAKKSNLNMLNDGTERPDHKQAPSVFGSQEDLGAHLSEQAGLGAIADEQGNGLTNDDISFRMANRAEQERLQAIPSEDDLAFESQLRKDKFREDVLGAVDTTKQFISDDLDQAGEILGTVRDAFIDKEFTDRVQEKGFTTAIGQDIGRMLSDEAETVDKVVDTVTKPAQVAIAAGKGALKHLFGIDLDKSKETVAGYEENATPEQKTQSDINVSETINTMSPEARVEVGSFDIKKMQRLAEKQADAPESKKYTPTAKQKAVAARMRANGLLSAPAFETYLETGRFSMADTGAAVAEQNARTNALKAQTEARKLTKELGADAFKELKETFEANIKSQSLLLKQRLNQVPAYDKSKFGHNFDLEKQSHAMLQVMTSDPRIQELLGAKNQFDFPQKALGQLAEVIGREGMKMIQTGKRNWFSDNDPASTVTSDKLHDAFKASRAAVPK